MNLTTDNLPLIPPPHLSASSISTFQQCPLRYKYSRIDNLPEPPSVDSLRGNFVHDVLENVYREESAVRTLSTARAIAKTIWGTCKIDNKRISYKSRALNCCQGNHLRQRSPSVEKTNVTFWRTLELQMSMQQVVPLQRNDLPWASHSIAVYYWRLFLQLSVEDARFQMGTGHNLSAQR